MRQQRSYWDRYNKDDDDGDDDGDAAAASSSGSEELVDFIEANWNSSSSTYRGQSSAAAPPGFMPVPLPPLPTKPVITYYEPSPSPRQLQPQPQLQPRQYQRQQQQQQRPSYRQQAYQQPELVSPPSRYQQQLSQSQYFDQTPQLLPESAVQHKTIGNTDGLVSVNQLPPQARSIFSFSHFNAMQSRAFGSIMSTNDNIVLSSPTGSGKSAICELAVIHLLFTNTPSNYSNNSNNTGKVLYIAPTKALCAERATDWSNKFGHLGFPCIEITGDSDTFSATITERIRKSTIIVSTPEKWDTILRRWRDGDKLMETVRLLLVDEVHHLSDQRGATLEAVITRMRLICKPLRVVAVSATVPNIRDIAKWLCESSNGRNGAVGRPAHVLEFGNEYRAVPLQCHVLAYPDGHGSSSQSEACVNPFLFEKSLDSKLLDIILQYSDSRPTLVFCSTRKSAEQAANALLESAKTRRGVGAAYFANIGRHSSNSNNAGGARSAFHDRRLSSLASCGIGYHHAGLDIADRRAAESAFSSGQINVLFTTSTLAVGVNLPARLVIVKSTMSYTSATASAVDVDASGPHSNGYREYTALELQQMVGRAGRPCFDSLGVGVIMTRESSRARCQQAVSGNGGGIPIESTLHLSLIEHLVAEISLGTVCDLATAVQWLENTYLAVRIRANPANYRMDILSHVDITNPQRMLVDICRSYLDMLRENGIVVCSKDGESEDAVYTVADRVQASEIGRSMTRNCVRYKTAVSIIQAFSPREQQQQKPTSSVPNGSTLRDVLMLVSRAEEYGPFRFRQGEKGLFNNLNRNPMLRYPIKGHRVQDASDKIVLMIQAILLGIPFASSGGNGGGGSYRNDSNRAMSINGATEGNSGGGGGSRYAVMAALNRDIFQVLQIASRVLRCMIDYLANTQLDASLALRNAITLLQYVHAKAWGDSSLQALQQVDTVGRQYASALIKAGINSIPKLLAADPSKVEAVLSRNPPFGLQLIKSARSKFPIVEAECSLSGSTLRVSLSLAHPLQQGQQHQNRTTFSAVSVVASISEPQRKLIGYWHYSCKTLPVAKGALSQMMTARIEPSLIEAEAKQVNVSVYSESFVGIDVHYIVDLKTGESTKVAERPTTIQGALAQMQPPAHSIDHQPTQSVQQQQQSTQHAQQMSTHHIESVKQQSEHPAKSKSTAKSKPPQPCKHRCKNKFACKHDCCKHFTAVDQQRQQRQPKTYPPKSYISFSDMDPDLEAAVLDILADEKSGSNNNDDDDIYDDGKWNQIINEALDNATAASEEAKEILYQPRRQSPPPRQPPSPPAPPAPLTPPIVFASPTLPARQHSPQQSPPLPPQLLLQPAPPLQPPAQSRPQSQAAAAQPLSPPLSQSPLRSPPPPKRRRQFSRAFGF